MTTPKKRVSILISGRGSNMLSLISAARAPGYPAEIACVISNRPKAAGLAKAESEGVPTATVDSKAFDSREAFEDALDNELKRARTDIIACAGFMRLMTAGFVDRWRDRMLNIHPSLLPSFKGLDTHERALESGVKIAGCTVHVVRAEVDSGPIIAQAAVPVLDNDTPETLAARVLEAEHQIYPHALALFAAGAVSVSGDRVTGQQVLVNQEKALIWPPLEAASGCDRNQS